MSWPTAAFPEALEDVSGGNAKIAQRDYLKQGRLSVVDQGQALIGGYTNIDRAQHRSDTPVIVFGDHTRVFKYIDFPFAMGADGVKVLRAKAGWDPRYLFHFLTSIELRSGGYSRHFKFLRGLRSAATDRGAAADRGDPRPRRLPPLPAPTSHRTPRGSGAGSLR